MQAEGKMNECRSLRCVDEQLSPEERARYARHLMLPEMGEEGQKKLKNSSVMVIGAGGLGSPTLLYLAAAGVGRIGIIDDDRVDTQLHEHFQRLEIVPLRRTFLIVDVALECRCDIADANTFD